MSTLYLTKLVIETTSPMAIYSGQRETSFDNQLVRDASGLPYIPATSIAGVWRKLVNEHCGKTCETDWFGDLSTDHSSNITLSNGVLLGSNNQAVKGLMFKKDIEQDPLLALLHQQRPMHRERVKINDRGVAHDKAKYDQLLLPTGVRFTLNIKVSDAFISEEMKAQRLDVLSLWVNEAFCLGATTRNGLGQFKVVGCLDEKINLAEGISAAKKIRDFYNSKNLPTTSALVSKYDPNLYAELPIKGLDNWRCGLGTERLGTEETENTVSIMTYSESKITWQDNQAKIQSEPVPMLCGSSIKGILAHRIAFHWRKHNNVWAETMAQSSHEDWQTRPEALKELLGFAADKHEDSLAGKLFVDDVEVVHSKTTVRTHTSIDRFTGGVRKGALYCEELLYQPEFTIKLRLAKNTTLSGSLKQALDDTLEDLKLGLLPMGAGSGRGVSLVMQNESKPWKVYGENISIAAEGLNKEVAHEH
jgi:CRISPR/Cas system CMR subunit Cmr4 (Cas7 group RAMP superfamily)